MDAAYFQAAIPQPYRIFGLQLLPLSLGRYRLLKRFGCGFVSDIEITATTREELLQLSGDLVLGLVICSMRVREFLEFIQSRSASRQLRKWSRRIRKQMAKERHFNLLAKFGLFRAYIEEASRLPNYWDESENQNSQSATHWSQNVEVALRSELNYTLEEIEEGPLSKALFDYFKHAENCGLIRLMGEGELELGAGNAAALQRAFNQGGACRA